MTQPSENASKFANNPDGIQIGKAAGLVGFYGIQPVVIRPYTSSVHATAALLSSADFAVTQLAILNEVQKTLVALGVWATV